MASNADSINKAYTRKLTTLFGNLPAEIMAAQAAAGFKAAVRHTYQDSGQFAYNWHIAIGGEEQKDEVAIRGTPPAGKRGAKRSRNDKWQPVYKSKMNEYGLTDRDSESVTSTQHKTLRKTKLYQKIIGSGATKVVLYNPYYTPDFAEYPVRAAERHRMTTKSGEKSGARSAKYNVKAYVRKAISQAGQREQQRLKNLRLAGK